MPKLKNKKGVAKRFRLTKTGKIKYHTGGKSHLLSAKTRKRLRGMKKPKTLGAGKETKFIKRMLPYS